MSLSPHHYYFCSAPLHHTTTTLHACVCNTHGLFFDWLLARLASSLATGNAGNFQNGVLAINPRGFWVCPGSLVVFDWLGYSLRCSLSSSMVHSVTKFMHNLCLVFAFSVSRFACWLLRWWGRPTVWLGEGVLKCAGTSSTRILDHNINNNKTNAVGTHTSRRAATPIQLVGWRCDEEHF